MENISKKIFPDSPLSASSRKGFSLLELMLVIALVGIMASVAIASFSGARDEAKIKAAQRELASNVKLAQSYALQGKTQGSIVPDYYSVRFLSSTDYVICYYCSDSSCPASCTPFERFSLADGVTRSGSSAVDFEVPYGNTTLPSDATFTLQAPGFKQTKTVSVSRSGLVTEN